MKDKKYEVEAKELYENTDAYREYENKTKGYSKEKWADAAIEIQNIFAEFYKCKKNKENVDSPMVSALVRKLQKHITENYYTCTDEILKGLGKMYISDQRFKNNIDKCGEGTAEYISAAIAHI